MSWIVKHKAYAFIIAGIVLFLFKEKIAAALTGEKKPGVKPVYDTVTSGTEYGVFDTNVLSPTFGEPL